MKLNITKPCAQDWDLMPDVGKGRFCAVCKRNVRDFSNSSDEEIYDELISNANVCGKFNSSQIHTNIGLSALSKVAFGLFLGLTANFVNGQEIKSSEDLGKFNLKKGLKGFKSVTDTLATSVWLGMPSQEDLESTRPKIFLDGFQISESKMKRLNPENIESVNILDGKSASKLYGAKAQFGAIVISSKKRIKGKAN